jgi:hypothetical protein
MVAIFASAIPCLVEPTALSALRVIIATLMVSVRKLATALRKVAKKIAMVTVCAIRTVLLPSVPVIMDLLMMG